MPPKQLQPQRRSRQETLEEDLKQKIMTYVVDDEEVFRVLRDALTAGVSVDLVVGTTPMICHFADVGLVRCFEECFILSADPMPATLSQQDALTFAVSGDGTSANILRMVTALSNHVKFRDLHRSRALGVACRRCLFDVVKLLLRHDPTPSNVERVLFAGLTMGSVELLRIAIAYGAKTKDTIQCCGRRPVDLAARLQDSRLLELLIDAGADFKSANASGESPILIAVQYGSANCVRLLIERKCCVTWGWAVGLAIKSRRHEVLRELLKEKSILSTVVECSNDFIYDAIANDDLESLKILFSYSPWPLPHIETMVRLQKYEMLTWVLFESTIDSSGISVRRFERLIIEAPNDNFKNVIQRKIDVMNGADDAKLLIKQEKT